MIILILFFVAFCRHYATLAAIAVLRHDYFAFWLSPFFFRSSFFSLFTMLLLRDDTFDVSRCRCQLRLPPPCWLRLAIILFAALLSCCHAFALQRLIIFAAMLRFTPPRD